MFGLVKRICLILVLASAANPTVGHSVDEYPTAARVEYGFGLHGRQRSDARNAPKVLLQH